MNTKRKTNVSLRGWQTMRRQLMDARREARQASREAREERRGKTFAFSLVDYLTTYVLPSKSQAELEEAKRDYQAFAVKLEKKYSAKAD